MNKKAYYYNETRYVEVLVLGVCFGISDGEKYKNYLVELPDGTKTSFHQNELYFKAKKNEK